MRRSTTRFLAIAAGAAVALTQAATASIAQESPEEFFEGKTLTLMHVTGPGGTMDLAALLAIDYMNKYLPEGTEVVLEHRPGGGGIVGTNYAVNAAPQDGTLLLYQDFSGHITLSQGA